MEKNTVFGWLDNEGNGERLYEYIKQMELDAQTHNGLMDAINAYVTSVLKEV